jgi:hypothetical protein
MTDDSVSGFLFVAGRGQPSVVLVCGGRTITDERFVFDLLDAWRDWLHFDAIIHGGARGVDSLAGSWAISRGVPQRVFPANWTAHGKAAGPIRNAQMLAERPIAVIAFPGGKGTQTCERQAHSLGIPVHRHDDERRKPHA